MTQNRLTIIETSPSNENSSGFTRHSRHARTQEMQARFERLWLQDPQQFNPLRNCMERERLERTWDFLNRHVQPQGQQAADIGCGSGVFARKLQEAQAFVDAVDIAENALKYVKEGDCQRIQPKQEAMPNTSLPDQAYDLIVCTELIAELPPDDYRLFFAELARLIKPNGLLICSSAIDIDSDGGKERLMNLAQTEFDIIDSISSYHALHIKLKRLCEIPSIYIQSRQNPDLQQKEMKKRGTLGKWWFKLNTLPPFVWLWKLVHPLSSKCLKSLQNSHLLLLRLEKVCRFLWDDKGISHYLFAAKRRPLHATNPETVPQERPKRKQVWE